MIEAQSAFYRPRPTLTLTSSATTTPYSDALKAAAILPPRVPAYITHHMDCLTVLRNEFRRSYITHMNATTATRAMVASAPYYVPQYRLEAMAASGALVYPMMYRPRIITHNSHFYEQK